MNKNIFIAVYIFLIGVFISGCDKIDSLIKKDTFELVTIDPAKGSKINYGDSITGQVKYSINISKKDINNGLDFYRNDMKAAEVEFKGCLISFGIGPGEEDIPQLVSAMYNKNGETNFGELNDLFQNNEEGTMDFIIHNAIGPLPGQQTEITGGPFNLHISLSLIYKVDGYAKSSGFKKYNTSIDKIFN